MSRYPFGAAIERDYYPVKDVDGLSEPFPVVSNSGSAYLYVERPSREDAQSGVGALATAVSWTYQLDNPFKASYQFDPISDPDPTGAESCREMVEVVNMILEGSAQVQTAMRPVFLERVRPLPEIPGTTINTIKDVFPQIDSYMSDSELSETLSVVEEQVKIELRSNGIEWAKVQNLRVLRLALAYRAIEFASIVQIKNTGDRHDRRRELFAGMYASTMKAVRLEQDEDGDGQTDSVRSGGASHFIISK